MREWIAGVDIDDWVRDITDSGRYGGQIPDDVTVRPEHVPSASTFVAVRLARLARTMGEGRRIQESDLADAYHVACGPYFDVLVTDDTELRNTLGLVSDRLSFSGCRLPSSSPLCREEGDSAHIDGRTAALDADLETALLHGQRRIHSSRGGQLTGVLDRRSPAQRRHPHRRPGALIDAGDPSRDRKSVV